MGPIASSVGSETTQSGLRTNQPLHVCNFYYNLNLKNLWEHKTFHFRIFCIPLSKADTFWKSLNVECNRIPSQEGHHGLLLFTHVFWRSLLGIEMRWVEMFVTELCSLHFSYIRGSSFLDSKCLENELLKCESGLCIENCKTGRGWLAALLYQRNYFFPSLFLFP